MHKHTNYEVLTVSFLCHKNDGSHVGGEITEAIENNIIQNHLGVLTFGTKIASKRDIKLAEGIGIFPDDGDDEKD